MNTLDRMTTCTPVRYRMGEFDDNRPKYTPAPFQILSMPSNTEDETVKETYVCPVPIYSEPSANDPILANDVLDDELICGRGQFGYMTDVMTVEEHQMGDGSDTILGLHAYGFI